MWLVIKLGGSLLFNINGELHLDLIDKWLDVLIDLTQCSKIIVVVGGGILARRYIVWGRRLNLTEFECDELGIHVSRLNAYLLLAALKQRIKATDLRVCGSIPTTPRELYGLRNSYDIIFVGGFIPGQSTIGVAAEAAEASQAKLLAIATDVKGIFDKDPKKYPDAKKLDEIPIESLIEMFLKRDEHAGTYALFDIQALKLIKRSKVTTIVFDGRDPENAREIILAFLRGNTEFVKRTATIIIT